MAANDEQIVTVGRGGEFAVAVTEGTDVEVQYADGKGGWVTFAEGLTGAFTAPGERGFVNPGASVDIKIVAGADANVIVTKDIDIF